MTLFLNLKDAVRFNNLEKVREFLENGADPNKVDHWNRTPIFIVSNNIEIARLLIQAGADLNHKDKDGVTPLWRAVTYGYPELVNLYLENGADPNLFKSGESLIEMAKRKLNQEISFKEKEDRKLILNLLDKAIRPSLERQVAEVLSGTRNPRGWLNTITRRDFPASMTNVRREQLRNKGYVKTAKNIWRGKYANRNANEAAGIPPNIGVKISNFLTPRKKINVLKEKWEKEAKNKGLTGGRKKTRKLRKSKY